MKYSLDGKMQKSNEMIAIKVRTKVTLAGIWSGELRFWGASSVLYLDHSIGYMEVHFIIIP